MYYYKTIIQYDGTNYAGFQWQNGLQTIQADFNHALEQLLDGKISTMGASRTDTGVHAIEQVVKVTSSCPIPLASFLVAFNQQLPHKIRCIDIVECAGDFRPAAHAIAKEYRYFFTNKTQMSMASLEDRKYIVNISKPLDFMTMNNCARALVGEHDFCNFYSAGSNVKSTIRTLSICELSMINPHDIFNSHNLFQIPRDLEQCYELKIEANGFLKQMIRHIVSALWMVGTGKMSADEFKQMIDGPKKTKATWKVAPPNGLFLYKITY